MNIEEFSRTILKISRNHWVFTLRGTRNLGFKKAKLVSQLLETDLEVWINPEKVLERQKAWKKFTNQEETR